MIHKGDDVIFNDLIEPVTIEQLVKQGYLAPLRSKHTQLTYSTDGVRKSAGDFVASAIGAMANTQDNKIVCISFQRNMQSIKLKVYGAFQLPGKAPFLLKILKLAFLWVLFMLTTPKLFRENGSITVKETPK